MEVFPDFAYQQGSRGSLMPMYDDKAKTWSYATGQERKLDRARFEEWKTTFYELEGFSTTSGRPTRKTLEDLGLKNVADVMRRKGTLDEV